MTGSVYTDRISQLCTEFKLPTVGSEAVPRFRDAGQAAALAQYLAAEGGNTGMSEGTRRAEQGYTQGTRVTVLRRVRSVLRRS